jgi:hypothetical protein
LRRGQGNSNPSPTANPVSIYEALADSFSVNPDFAIGVRTETSEVESFSTQKVKAMQGHRLNFLRKKKSGIVRRIPHPIAKSGFKKSGFDKASMRTPGSRCSGFFIYRDYDAKYT